MNILFNFFICYVNVYYYIKKKLIDLKRFFNVFILVKNLLEYNNLCF